MAQLASPPRVVAGCATQLNSALGTAKLSMSKRDFSRLKRPRYTMPKFVRSALVDSGLMDAFENRPPYQQNDYIAWITRAKREETKVKRLAQMLSELKRGDLYMKMDYKPSIPHQR